MSTVPTTTPEDFQIVCGGMIESDVGENVSNWLDDVESLLTQVVAAPAGAGDATGCWANFVNYFKKPRMGMALIPAFLYYMSVFITIPLTSLIVIQQVCDKRDDYNNDDDCTSSDVSKHAAMVDLYLQLSLYLPAFMTAGFYGLMADRLGRKLTMLIPLTTYLVYLSCLVGIVYFQPKYWNVLLIMASMLFGCSGAYNTFGMALFSYASDITSSDDRSYYFSLIEGSLFISKVLGPLVGGVWAAKRGFVEPLSFSLMNTFVCIIFIVFCVKESFSSEKRKARREQRRAEGLSKTTICNSLVATFDNIRWLVTLTADKNSGNSKYNDKNNINSDDDSSRSNVDTIPTRLSLVSIPAVYVFWAFFLFYIPAMAEGGITIFYLTYKFSWDSDYIGYFLAAEASLLVVSMVVVPEVVKYLRSNRPVHDIYWVLLGYCTRVIYYMSIPFQKSMNSLFSLTLLLLLAGSTTPRSRSIISNSVSVTNQAKALSAFAAIQSLALLLTPVFDAIYSGTVEFYAGTIYFVFSTFCFAAACIILYVLFNPVLCNLLPTNSHDKVSSNKDILFVSSAHGDNADGYSVDDYITKPLLESDNDGAHVL